ncbi:hypothetical protein PROFUN_10071 [Planoprotostelium fungivorum]|uniref:Uncharacterized protein n=1 Tax=Planoprotostelium fungivorum TaxID=1890364 RepID=A0A2P6NEZ2_9EUKA|nr:hypothetical protein PROFUN_10071 [Planoprotostelium fungivorum]
MPVQLFSCVGEKKLRREKNCKENNNRQLQSLSGMFRDLKMIRRKSFGNFNPAVEKLHEEKEEKKPKEKVKKEKEVTQEEIDQEREDEDMAEREGKLLSSHPGYKRVSRAWICKKQNRKILADLGSRQSGCKQPDSPYVDYKRMKLQINMIKDKAITLAEAYHTIYEITGEEINVNIDLKRVQEEELFWSMMNQSNNNITEFYRSQVSSMLVQFDALTKQCIRLNLINSYNPKEKAFSSRLDRELHRRRDLKFVFNFKTDKINPGGGYTKKEESLPLKALTADAVQDTRLLAAAKKQASKYMNTTKLRESFQEFYRGLVLLESFCELNHEAIRKLVKKFDKVLGTHTRDHYMKSVVDPCDWVKNATLKLLTAETEHVFSKAFTEGRRTKAMEELRIPKNQKQVGLSIFRNGLYVGLSVPLFILTIYLLATRPSKDFEHYESMFIVYRMLGMLVVMVWCWGLDMYIWTKFRVNYVFIFEVWPLFIRPLKKVQFNARSHARYQNILESASLFTLIWMGSVFIYIITNTEKDTVPWLRTIPVQIHPFLLCLTTLFVVLFFQLKTRAWLMWTVLRILAAPFKAVRFRDFFLADQMASISIVLYDLEYTICYFAFDAWTDEKKCMAANVWARPLIASLPAFWRFLQCFRRYRDDHHLAHLANAGKYSCTFFVAIFSVLRANVDNDYMKYWLMSVVVSTIYSNYWDVVRDWGLGDPESKFLRKKLIYKRPAFYYFAIISNFILRLSWLLSISPDTISQFVDPTVFAILIATLEILRRCQWNLLRLENEQLNNVGRYRSTNVFVPPSDQETVKGDLVEEKKYTPRFIKKAVRAVRGFGQSIVQWILPHYKPIPDVSDDEENGRQVHLTEFEPARTSSEAGVDMRLSIDQPPLDRLSISTESEKEEEDPAPPPPINKRVWKLKGKKLMSESTKMEHR